MLAVALASTTLHAVIALLAWHAGAERPGGTDAGLVSVEIIAAPPAVPAVDPGSATPEPGPPEPAPAAAAPTATKVVAETVEGVAGVERLLMHATPRRRATGGPAADATNSSRGRTPVDPPADDASSAAPAGTEATATETRGSPLGTATADTAADGVGAPSTAAVGGTGDRASSALDGAPPTNPARGAGDGADGADPTHADVVARYGRIVWAKVAARRPAGLRRAGSTRLVFTVAADGALLASSVARSSGSESLDRLALNTLREASPFPPPPPALQATPVTFLIAFEFR